MPEYEYKIYKTKGEPPQMLDLFDAPDDTAAADHAEQRAKPLKDLGLHKGSRERLSRKKKGGEDEVFDRPI